MKKIWRNLIFKIIFWTFRMILIFLVPYVVTIIISEKENYMKTYSILVAYETIIILSKYFLSMFNLRKLYNDTKEKCIKLNEKNGIKNDFTSSEFLSNFNFELVANFEYFLNLEFTRIENKIEEYSKELEELKKENYMKKSVGEFQLKSAIKNLELLNDRLSKKEELLDGFLKIIEILDTTNINFEMYYEEILYYIEKYMKVTDVVVIKKIDKGYDVFIKLLKDNFELTQDMIYELEKIKERVAYNENVNRIAGYEVIMNLTNLKDKNYGYILINGLSSKYLEYPVFMKIVTTISTEFFNIVNNLYYVEKINKEKEKYQQEVKKLKIELDENQSSLEVQLEQISNMYEEIVILYEAGKNLGKIFDRKKIEKIILDMILEIVEAEYGMVYYYSNEKRLTSLSMVVFSEKENEEITKAMKILVKNSDLFLELREKGTKIVVNDTNLIETSNEKLEYIKEVFKNFIEIPIYSGSEIIGAVVILNKKEGDFTAANISLATALTNQMGMSVQNIDFLNKEIERKKEEEQLKIASRIQSKLFPQEMPLINNFEIFGMNEPAKAVGGDYFDFIKLNENDLIGIIADVSGKGIPAALLVSMVRTIFRMIVEHFHEYSVDKILFLINNILCNEEIDGRFVTAACFKLNSKTSEIEIANAGHDPIMHYKTSQETIEELEIDGTVLGIEANEKFEKIKIKIEKGDVVLLYTDGVVEARNKDDEFFEFDRLRNIIYDNNKYPSGYIVRKIYREVTKFMGNESKSDDITIISIKGV